MRTFAILPAIAALAACASIPPPQANYRAERVDLPSPQPGATVEAAVGEVMLAKGQVTRTQGITYAEPVKLDQFTLSPGFYPLIGEDETYAYYGFRSAPAHDGSGYVLPARSPLGSWLPAPDAVRVAKAGGETCIVFVELGEKACDPTATFERTSREDLAQRDLNQKLIYRGVHDGVIELTYWEASGHPARPEASQALEFKLEPETEISFRGARVRILSADAKAVRYQVLANFADYWGG